MKMLASATGVDGQNNGGCTRSLSASRTEDGNAPVISASQTTQTMRGVVRTAASKAKGAATRVPLSVDVLIRHWSRSIAKIDSQTLPALNAQYARVKRTREGLAYRVRMALAKQNVATVPMQDPFVSSVSVRQEQKVRPARVAWYDGRAKLLPVRPTEIVVERKRGKVIPSVRVAQKGFVRVCPACKPDAMTPYMVSYCEAHA